METQEWFLVSQTKNKNQNWKQNKQSSHQLPVIGKRDTGDWVEASYYKSIKSKKSNNKNNPGGTNLELQQFII